MPSLPRPARPLVLPALLGAALALTFGTPGGGPQPAAPAVALASLPVQFDSDGDGYSSILEKYLASDESDPASTPEHMSVGPSARFAAVPWPATCSDGVDNDGDGDADAADGGCLLPPLAPFEGEMPPPGVYGFPATATLETDHGIFDFAGPFVVELGARQDGVLPLEIVALQLQTSDGVTTILESLLNASTGTIESQGPGGPFFPASSVVDSWVVLAEGGEVTTPLPLTLSVADVHCLPPSAFPLPCRGHVAVQGCYIAAGTQTSVCPEWPLAAPSPSPTPAAPGDTDCDEDVDSVDALMVLRETAGLPHSAACITMGDVDCDADRDSVDALRILRHVAALSNPQWGCPGGGTPPPTATPSPTPIATPTGTPHPGSVDQQLTGDPTCTDAALRSTVSSTGSLRQEFVPAMPTLLSVDLCISAGSGKIVQLNILDGTAAAPGAILASASGLTDWEAYNGYLHIDLPSPLAVTPGHMLVLEIPESYDFAWRGTCAVISAVCTSIDADLYPPGQASYHVGDFGFRTYGSNP